MVPFVEETRDFSEFTPQIVSDEDEDDDELITEEDFFKAS
jgi:hypothetical protein